MNSEKYTHGHHRSVTRAHSIRRASDSASFVLPRLKSPIRLLDFGCGPGTITIDLAEHLLPNGSVVGIDNSSTVIDQARVRLDQKGTQNISFEVRSIYETGYGAKTFDAVYAHQVLQHLSEPVMALSEAKRVLKPRGICAVREVDWGASALWPPDERLLAFLDVYSRVAACNGGNASAGRQLKEWFMQAEFSDLEVTTSNWSFSDQNGLKWWGEQWSERILHSELGKRAIDYGIATDHDLEEISQGWLDWVNTPGAFFAFIQVEVIGVSG